MHSKKQSNNNSLCNQIFNEKTERIGLSGTQKQYRMQAETDRKLSSINIEKITRIRQHHGIQNIYQSFILLHNLCQVDQSQPDQQFSNIKIEKINTVCRQLVKQISEYKNRASQQLENNIDNDSYSENVVTNSKIQQLLQQIYYLRKRVSELDGSFQKIDSIQSLSLADENRNPNVMHLSGQRSPKISNNKKHTNIYSNSSRNILQSGLKYKQPKQFNYQLGPSSRILDPEKQEEVNTMTNTLIDYLEQMRQLNFVLLSQSWKLISFLPKTQDLKSYLFQQINYVYGSQLKDQINNQKQCTSSFLVGYERSLDLTALLSQVINKFIKNNNHHSVNN